jgi:hypothetical protein
MQVRAAPATAPRVLARREMLVLEAGVHVLVVLVVA